MTRRARIKTRRTKANLTRFRCGPLRVDYREKRRGIVGHTCSGEKTKGDAWIYRVTISGEEYMDIAYIIWRTGERDVQADTVESSIRALRRLEHGLRLGVDKLSSRLSVIELRQARIKDPRDRKQWSNCFMASLCELRRGAGLNVGRALRRAGVITIGSKQDVLEDLGPHRGFLCATFARNAQWPPVVAYVLTRVLPLVRGYTQEG